MKNLYDELGVSTHATLEEIKKAYRKKAQENHPDKGGDTETFQAISKPYEILSNYDYTVEQQPPQVWHTHGASTTSAWGR